MNKSYNQFKKNIHDEKGIEVPQWLKEIGFDFPRDLNKLHALMLPIEEMSIKELEWHLDMPFFWQIDKPFSLKPRDVLNNPEQYEYRMSRIMGVDTNYPIDIMWWKGKWEILDGLHRLCKQVIEGKTVIKVRKVPVELKKMIVPDFWYNKNT